MTRDSFVFYRSFLDGLKALGDADRLACYDAIAKYGLDGVTEAEGISAAVLALVKPLIDSNNQKYENGKKGGRPKNQDETKANQTETKQEPNHNQTITKQEPNHNQTETKANLNDKCEMLNDKCEMGIDKKEGRSRASFVKPTVEEVAEYCRERQNNVSPEAFVSYYESNGWKIGGKTAMKDWRAAVRTWEQRESREPPKAPAPQKPRPKWQYQDQRTYDYDELERKLLGRAYES